MRLNACTSRMTSSESASGTSARWPGLARSMRSIDVDELVQRREAAAQHDAVDEHGAEDAGDEHERLARPPTSSSDRRAAAIAAAPVARISSALTARIWVASVGLRMLGSRPHIGRWGQTRYSWCSKSRPEP